MAQDPARSSDLPDPRISPGNAGSSPKTGDDLDILVQRMANGDREAVAAFLSAYGPLIRRRVRGKLTASMRRVLDSEDILATVGRRLDYLISEKKLNARSGAELWSVIAGMTERAVLEKGRQVPHQAEERIVTEAPAKTAASAPKFASIAPSRQSLVQLPRWARVAFAVRCARRVQPIILLGQPSVPQELVVDLDGFLEEVERAARIGGDVKIDGRGISSGSGLGDGVGKVLLTTAFAVQSVQAKHVPFAVDSVLDAYKAALEAASFATTTDDGLPASDAAEMIAATRSDLRLLTALAEDEHWTNESPVDVKLLGPLWPDGSPTWWPAHGQPSGESTVMILPHPRIAVVWDAEAVPEEDYAEIMGLLGELARASGAIGIQRMSSGECEIGIAGGVAT